MALADAPPMASAYVKQCMEMDKGGRFSLRKNDYLVTLRAWVAFDPAKSHVGRITIKDPAAMMREVREEVRKQIA
jgi:hypothetical protein